MPAMPTRPRVVNRMPAFVARVPDKLARGMTQALVLGGAEASVMTPIDTSTLLNSQYRRVERQGTRVVGTIGYTASYALPVHDPANPQRFRRSTAEKAFLTKGMERAEPNIKRALREGLK